MSILFKELNTAWYGDSRRKKTLFLPNYLQRMSTDQRLRGKQYDRAYAILLTWADLEKSGKLQTKSETSLHGEFITQVFGEALGYKLFSEGLDEWEVEPEFPINGGKPDAAIGHFSKSAPAQPRVMLELKGPTANVDRDRFNGRTPVQQCWDYLNAVPQCPWGIVSNYVSFRLYHRDKTPSAYELFVLQDLRKPEVFAQFYYLFEAGGLLRPLFQKPPRAELLLKETTERQREVGKELYQDYRNNRLALIHHLRDEPHKKSTDSAIRIAQKLLDRIIFVAFCEDRDLLPSKSIERAWKEVPPFSRVTNPRWQNFLQLFRSIDEGHPGSNIPPFNGGLFREDPEVDSLELHDDWTVFFKDISSYDFRDEVNVDVLGHLFEQSINDLESLKLGVIFSEAPPKPGEKPKMQKSAERKLTGTYYTPPEFTTFIVRNTVLAVIEQKCQAIARRLGVTQAELDSGQTKPEHGPYWKECFEAVRQIKICDPACGSGAFLIQAYELLEGQYLDFLENLAAYDANLAKQLRPQVPDIILRDNLFGVDLSQDAVEITQLALWIRSARQGRTLSDLSRNIRCGNSLVTDPAVHSCAMVWPEAFPEVFSRAESGFDCVIGNPPWERMKLQEREFFDKTAPEIGSATDAAKRERMIAALETKNPELYARYLAAKATAAATLDHVRNAGNFPLTAKGDINTYVVFAELAHSIVAPAGRVGLLVPSGIAADMTSKDFFNVLMAEQSLVLLYDFENKQGLFADVHRAFKFSILVFGGKKVRLPEADFVFFAHAMEDLRDTDRHIPLSAADMAVMNPNTKTCPIFRTRRDAQLTREIYKHVPVLWDRTRKKGGNPWGVKFLRMFDQTNDANLFESPEKLKSERFKLNGNIWVKGKKRLLPLYEAKMIQAYDHRAASVVVQDENWFRQGQTEATTLVQHQNPEFCVMPRWWAVESVILERRANQTDIAQLAFKNVTSPTNSRTMIAAFIPCYGVVNSAPLIGFDEGISATVQCCLLANLNAFVLDYVARRKIGNVNLNFFLIEQFPLLGPDAYQRDCPWNKRQKLEDWISDRVLKLTCTSDDMRPFAKAAGLDPEIHKWDPQDRAQLQAELDAAYFILYGIEREDVEYILSTFTSALGKTTGIFGGGQAQRILGEYDRLSSKAQA